MTHDTQPSLLTWRAEETTSGPRSPASDGERIAATPAERWGAFTRAHPDIAAWVLAEARDAIARGEKRVSTKALIERARALFRVSINNNATSAAADWLVAEDVSIDAVVERRARSGKP